MAKPYKPPSSILIIGSGVFGLGTAYALARRPAFAATTITVVSKPDVGATSAVNPASPDDGFPPSDAASSDSSRIVRADYADPAYAALGAAALAEWRKTAPGELGADGRYNEAGLVLVADDDGTDYDAAGSAAALPASGSKRKTGMSYVRASWANVQALAADNTTAATTITTQAQHLRALPTRAAIRDAVGTGGASGAWGYFNGSSGWADAAAAMRWLYARVRETGRVRFLRGRVEALAHRGARVEGAWLRDGQFLGAELVVLAAGAWSPTLVDLAGEVVATGQVMAYVDLTEEEQRRLKDMPTLLNLTTGLFIITPAKGVLKIARHAYGYLNPTGAAPLRQGDSEAHATAEADPSQNHPRTLTLVSRPLTTADDPSLTIPPEGALALRQALREMIPWPELKDRPFTRTRLCWYADTPTGDFLIDYHPTWAGLFLATGDSGHALKFLPVLGERIADCIAGACPAEFAETWKWKGHAPPANAAVAVVTEDGSRGGKPGLILKEELLRPAAP